VHAKNPQCPGKSPNDPKLAQKAFRNVSIITAFNAQKDRINQLGCERFAAENNQTLTSFYSIDRWKDPEQSRKKKGLKGAKKQLIDPVRKTNIFSSHLQKNTLGTATCFFKQACTWKINTVCRHACYVKT
jgi:hypothetical protein